MKTKQFTRSVAKWLAAGIGISAASYATCSASWFRYGKAKRAAGKGADALIDMLMPDFEVMERHKVPVAAPAEVSSGRQRRSGEAESVFRTETRAAATDPEARKKFRWYWSFLSPGIIALRTMMLPAVKAEGERRWREIRGIAA